MFERVDWHTTWLRQVITHNRTRPGLACPTPLQLPTHRVIPSSTRTTPKTGGQFRSTFSKTYQKSSNWRKSNIFGPLAAAACELNNPILKTPIQLILPLASPQPCSKRRNRAPSSKKKENTYSDRELFVSVIKLKTDSCLRESTRSPPRT